MLLIQCHNQFNIFTKFSFLCLIFKVCCFLPICAEVVLSEVLQEVFKVDFKKYKPNTNLKLHESFYDR